MIDTTEDRARLTRLCDMVDGLHSLCGEMFATLLHEKNRPHLPAQLVSLAERWAARHAEITKPRP